MTEDRLTALKESPDYEAMIRQEEWEHKQYMDQQIACALVANLKLWLKHDGACDIPEVFATEVVANTGLQGGDSGHGGRLAIRFLTQGSGCNAIAVRPEDDAMHSEDGFEGEVVLTARGDWEQSGLIAGLASLLVTLLEPTTA